MDTKENIFLSILESHKGIIYKVAHNYCYDPAHLDDLIQEITLQIWQSIDNFKEQYKWSTWIYRIALNTSISFYRKNKSYTGKTVRLDPIIEMPVQEEESSEDTNIILLRKFIRELKEIDRALILLHLDGLSSQEIAQIMGLTTTNVTSKIHRIKKKLKTKFQTYNHK